MALDAVVAELGPMGVFVTAHTGAPPRRGFGNLPVVAFLAVYVEVPSGDIQPQVVLAIHLGWLPLSLGVADIASQRRETPFVWVLVALMTVSTGGMRDVLISLGIAVAFCAFDVSVFSPQLVSRRVVIECL